MNKAEELTFEPDYFEAVTKIMSVVEDLTGHRTFNEELDVMLNNLLEDLRALGLRGRRQQNCWWKQDLLIEKKKRLSLIRLRLKNIGHATRPTKEYIVRYYKTGQDPEHKIMRRPVRKN